MPSESTQSLQETFERRCVEMLPKRSSSSSSTVMLSRSSSFSAADILHKISVPARKHSSCVSGPALPPPLPHWTQTAQIAGKSAGKTKRAISLTEPPKLRGTEKRCSVPLSQTMPEVTAAVEKRPSNYAIQTLMQADSVHQQSLVQKYVLNSIVQDMKPRKPTKSSFCKKVNNAPFHCKTFQNASTKPAVKTSDNSADNSGEILTIFDAMRGLSVQSPAYWIGCSFVYLAISKRLEIKIRQTGVQPKILSDVSSCKLLLEVSLLPKKKQKTTIPLKKSSRDTTFRSHSIMFKHVDATKVRQQGIRMRVFFKNGVLKKRLVEEWTVPLQKCEAIFEHTDWKRCIF